MKKILILVDTSRGPGRDFLEGVENFIGSGTDWEVSVPPPKYINDQAFNLPAFCSLQKPDGILVFGYYRLNELRRIKTCKVIMHHDMQADSATAVLSADSGAIAKMAADYFKGLGYTRFGYCSCVNLSWSRIRREVFEQEVRESGGSFSACHFELTVQKDISRVHRELAVWIASLPKPTALFVCNDDIAFFVMEACKLASVHIPDEVAVLGVDDDELVCRMSTPSLSSIQLNFEACGFKAARHLDTMISGRPELNELKVSPLRVMTRESTDSLAVDDALVRESLVFIRKNFHGKIAVSDVVDHMAVSRSNLEKRFRKCLKKSIADELSRLRVELIKSRLMTLSLSINEIAQSFSFSSPEHFSRFFHKEVGLTPGQYRKANRPR